MASIQFRVWFSVIAILLCRTIFAADCSHSPTTLQLTDGPYQNYFYSDCHSSNHVIITSPESTSDLARIGPRLLVAWPAGNSGIVSVFEPQNGQRGTLGIHLNSLDSPQVFLSPIFVDGQPNPEVGVSGHIEFNSSAVLVMPILGSIRTMRDYVENDSKPAPNPIFQQANQFMVNNYGGAMIKRTWLDNITTTWLSFAPLNGASAVIVDPNGNGPTNATLKFGAGQYEFRASFNYPQETRLSPAQVLNQGSTGLITTNPDEAKSLSFLSYNSKLLAGTWRFLTYFGRDSMISGLLLQPVLSVGKDSAVEAIIGSVLERVKKADGSVCHEESIGDFVTYANMNNGLGNTDSPSCDYKMVDTDYFLPIIMKNYFVDSNTGKNRLSDFMNTTASFLADNKGMKYSALAQLPAEKIMASAAPFAAYGGQKVENLIHLAKDQSVGDWRDSGYGLGNGRIPYDVNTALVPAALRSIAALSKAGIYANHPEWTDLATAYADIWEDYTLKFFEVTVPMAEAKSAVDAYVAQVNPSLPSQKDAIQSDIVFHGLALNGSSDNTDRPIVKVMNTDDCFRLFLLESSNQTQLSSFLNQAADNILRPFPAGLSTAVGLVVANPALSGSHEYAERFGHADYHGTVVWSWQLAMMAAGLEKQLRRCQSSDAPDFCSDSTLHAKVLKAYNSLWDTIDGNKGHLGNEVWTWVYNNGFQFQSLGSLSSTESDIRQLWSLTFLAITRQALQ